jgi:hypothetical protein
MRKNRALLLLLPALLALLALVLVGCKDFSFYGVLGDRIDDTPVQIAPSAASVAVGATLDFTATGGKPPYSYLVASGPGSFSDADTFFASAAGTVQVQVTDSKGRTSIAMVSVTSTGSPLAISPTDVSMGPGGHLQFVASGGAGSPPAYFFTLAASSESGATLSAGGDYLAGPNLGQDTIELTDGVDTVTAQVDVTAALTHVEYELSSSSIPATGTGGDDFTYFFTIQNTGTANGTKQVYWWLYLSDDGLLNSGDTLLGSGSTGFLASLASAPITSQTGTWPRSNGSKTLFVMIAAEDDLTVYTSGGLPVLLSPPAINYRLSGLTPGSTRTAGGALSGTFDLANSGTSDGKQPVNWTIYVSTNSSWDATDPVADAGSVAALDALSTLTGGIAFDGTWPPAPGDYYLIVRVFASDEPSPANTDGNELISPVTTDVPNYDVPMVSHLSGTTTGAMFTGSFTLRNTGTVAGGADVAWTVYASKDNNSLEIGTDVLVDAGTYSLPRLGPFPAQTDIGIQGTWPDVEGSYYLIVVVAAADEIDFSNNAGTTVDPPVSVTRPRVNYSVSSFSYSGTAPFAPATPATGSFRYSNASLMDNGTQWVNWTIYASLDGTIDASDIVVASGSLPPLSSGQTSGLIPFNGLWPLVYGNYSLILQAGSSWEFEVNPADNRILLAATTVGIYNAIVQEGNCLTLTPFTDLPGVVLKPGMSLKVVSAGFPDTHLDHLFRLNTGTANSLTVTWILGPPPPAPTPVELGIYIYYDQSPLTPLGKLDGGYYLNSPITELSMNFPFELADQNSLRWIDLYNPKTKVIGRYELFITAN